ncbi:helix-turn-helix transcriptional regulator [Acinetobacter sp. Marseille-Q1618]|uniref:helix-turn-helix domain-containing protein n=1 Tax=Acinetobacter sp. Marseille-Q1618 TaxID=2697502 RepID=UPI00156FC848|nr:helix-turn-helix transcriptional regulator [Acinetobacter sp. Marseille-Q1618]
MVEPYQILIAERKIRVADLIRRTSINKMTLRKLYNGDLTRIDLETIDRICEYLDIQVGDLFVFEKNFTNQINKEYLGHRWSL